MNLIARLFAKLTPDPLAELRKVQVQNAEDFGWLDDEHRLVREAQEAEHAARNALQAEPTEANFRRSAELTALLPARIKACAQARVLAAGSIRNRIVERTLPPLRVALPRVREQLEKERAAILKTEAEIAERIGVEAQRESPAVAKLNEEIRRGESLERRIVATTPEDSDLVRKAVGFCLGTR